MSLATDAILVSVQAVDVFAYNIDRPTHVRRTVPLAACTVYIARNRHTVSGLVGIAVVIACLRDERSGKASQCKS